MSKRNIKKSITINENDISIEAIFFALNDIINKKSTKKKIKKHECTKEMKKIEKTVNIFDSILK